MESHKIYVPNHQPDTISTVYIPCAKSQPPWPPPLLERSVLPATRRARIPAAAAVRMKKTYLDGPWD